MITVDDIEDVQVMTLFGSTVYMVTLKNGTIVFVPNDPDNNDWAAVQEWLAQNP